MRELVIFYFKVGKNSFIAVNKFCAIWTGDKN